MSGKIRVALLMLATFTASTWACFDTFLFLQRGSMVYPYRTLAVEALGEYSFNAIKDPESDSFLGNFNLYYGLFRKASFQIGFGSSEKERHNFSIDEIRARGVYNLVNIPQKGYTLDGILECSNNSRSNELNFEISAPSIFVAQEFVLVLHPVLNIVHGSNTDFTAGGHAGVFRVFENATLLGIGAEYQSAQSSSYKQRLVKGESAASIFFGARIGKYLFLQNELAKGLANSRDFGFASTLKFVFGGQK
jgi:hypothetical protein